VGRRCRRESGAALIAVLLAMALLAALGGGLLQVTATEARIAAHHRQGLEALYGAEALAERIRAELSSVPDVDTVLAGLSRSSAVDGPPGGVRIVHGALLDLSAATSMEQCGRRDGCSDAAVRAVTTERPWGANNPRWRLYAHAWLRQVVERPDAPPIYLVGWIGDDPFETDGDPLRDGMGAGRHRLAIRVRAYGPVGTRREIEVVIGDIPRRPRPLRWQER
jgi:hypothetical protein